MKASIAFLFTIVAAVTLAAPSELFAQAPDTVIVSANPPGTSGLTIEQFIMGDTTSAGLRNNPNRVYVLQQTAALDTPYYYLDPLQLRNFSVTIIGRTNPITGMPPVIQPGIRQDNSSPGNFIVSSTKNNRIMLRYLYFLGLRYDTTAVTGHLINASGDSTAIMLDHCVFDNVCGNGTIGNFNGNWNKFSMTNCEFRNGSSQFWQAGNVMWAINGVPMDSVRIVNNTFFCMGRSLYGGPAYYKALLVDHNTFFLSVSSLLSSNYQSNARISNNIFYGVIAHGADTTWLRTNKVNDGRQGFGIIMLDSIGTVGTTYSVTEAQRNVVVENNAYCWPQALHTLWDQVNGTTAGLLVPPVWMNPNTAAKFNDKTTWPGFSETNNDSVDPGFPSALVQSGVDSLVKFLNLVNWSPHLGNAGTFRWWQYRTIPYPGSIFNGVPSTWTGWDKGYPVPENLTYSNTTLQEGGTNSYALGDLNWYPSQLALFEAGGVNAVQPGANLPSEFFLSNNYPNPFNPSTTIRIGLNRPGRISLEIYNVLGQQVKIVDRGFKPAGIYEYNVAMDRFASGVYFYTLREGSSSITKKMLLLK